MYPQTSNGLYAEIHRLQKLIHGAESQERLYHYSSEIVAGWKRRLNELIEQDLRERPHIARNEGGP